MVIQRSGDLTRDPQSDLQECRRRISERTRFLRAGRPHQLSGRDYQAGRFRKPYITRLPARWSLPCPALALKKRSL